MKLLNGPERELFEAIVKTMSQRFIKGRKQFVGQEVGIPKTHVHGFEDVLMTTAIERLFDERLVAADGELVWLTPAGEDAARIRWPGYFHTMTVYEQVKANFPPDFLPYADIISKRS